MALISTRGGGAVTAAQAVLAGPGQAARAYTETATAAFGRYLPGAAALQSALLRRRRVTSAATRLLTAPVVGRLVAGTWSVYWNGLADGAQPHPAAWAAAAVQRLTSLGPATARWDTAQQTGHSMIQI